MGMWFAPTWLRQVSPPASQDHFIHWQCGGGGRRAKGSFAAGKKNKSDNKHNFTKVVAGAGASYGVFCRDPEFEATPLGRGYSVWERM